MAPAILNAGTGRDSFRGLSVHKSTHHFDLVNWWLGQNPEEVFAYGALNYYG
nr:Gfo/Idh/MocA family oxidoreductase [Bacillus subtilis]